VRNVVQLARGPVPIPLRVAPSDTIAADVSVTGTTVAFRLDDLTTGNGFATEATIAAPDLSSAEWIAEAPSDCNPFNRNGCSIVPLANFGTIAITAASAQTADHRPDLRPRLDGRRPRPNHRLRRTRRLNLPALSRRHNFHGHLAVERRPARTHHARVRHHPRNARR
jgi:Peptidase A4 family